MSKAITAETSRKVAQIILNGCSPHKNLRTAREHGMHVIPYRDAAIELCLPYADRLVSTFIKLPAMSRVDADDLKQAARMGVVEGVDNFEPHRGVQIQTHLFMRMRYRINRECEMGHWTIMRPPKEMVQRYMSGQMTPGEQEAYLNKFIRPFEDAA